MSIKTTNQHTELTPDRAERLLSAILTGTKPGKGIASPFRRDVGLKQNCSGKSSNLPLPAITIGFIEASKLNPSNPRVFESLNP
jgi:hypothetical protein